MSELRKRVAVRQLSAVHARSNRVPNLVMAMFMIAIIFVAVVSMVSDKGPYTCSDTKVFVKPGDNITSIVRANCEGNLGRAIDDAAEINGTRLMPNTYVELKPNG